VGMEGTGKKAERGAAWRRVWRGKTLPAIAAFKVGRCRMTQVDPGLTPS